MKKTPVHHFTATRDGVIAAAKRIHADHASVIAFGTVRVAVDGTDDALRFKFRRIGGVGVHSISADPSITSLARLTAHIAGFVGVELT